MEVGGFKCLSTLPRGCANKTINPWMLVSWTTPKQCKHAMKKIKLIGWKKSWSWVRSTLGWGTTLVGGSITLINIVSLWQVVLKFIDVPIRHVGFNPRNVLSWIENDNELTEVIWVNKFVYEKPFKVAWVVWNWRSKSTKGN